VSDMRRGRPTVHKSFGQRKVGFEQWTIIGL
jgi:hypothetical protein